MRRNGLRGVTRKEAVDRERHKLKTRLSAGDKRNRKRMPTVASAYSIAPHHRIAEITTGAEKPENTRNSAGTK
jgi:hypothetical protein